jgi:hypothetical protein
MKNIGCHCEKKCFSEIGLEEPVNGGSIALNNSIFLQCSPVGNETAIRKKVQIALSGFCVAREAAGHYQEDIRNGTSIDRAARNNTFNTNPMKNGIRAILHSLGFSAQYADTLVENLEETKDWLFTQMLCAIIVDGKSTASTILSKMNADEQLKRFVELSLERWRAVLHTKLQDKGLLLIMGNEAEKLLSRAVIQESGRIKLLSRKTSDDNALKKELEQKYIILFVAHAAALSPVHRWLTAERYKVNKELMPMFKPAVLGPAHR